MALKATIFKADLQVSDLDRNYYQRHELTIARHPSETDERMMVRVLAFALHADEALTFTRGLSADEEPDLWRKDLTGEIDLWIEVGLPDERRLRKACGRARKVVVYAYGERAARTWWQTNAPNLERLNNLRVREISDAVSEQLALLARRNMSLNCTIQDQAAWLDDGENTIEVAPLVLKGTPDNQG